jgi:signal transduction histidine kinase
MASLRLQTKFLLTVLLVSATLTGTALLVVRRSVQDRVRQEIFRDLESSVLTFQQFQAERQTTLSRTAELLAGLPNVRALMTTRDAATIQDASQDTWRVAGSDLFVLTAPSGKVMALHAIISGLNPDSIQESLLQSLRPDESLHWWQQNGHLYEVYLQPIYFGEPQENRLLGYLALGYEVNRRVADTISRISSSQVAFRYDSAIVATTLRPQQEDELVGRLPSAVSAGSSEVRLGDEQFLTTSVDLSTRPGAAVQLIVLKSLDQETMFLNNLNHELIALGFMAVLGGSLLVFFISNAFARPLQDLVAGVRALGHGDFNYPLQAKGGDEVAEVTVAFDRMRSNLQRTQRELLDAERLATIGMMASSISHDLRHSLAAIVANAEFLCESKLTGTQREELYGEVRTAVNQMNDLIESLLEFSRTRESLRPAAGNMQHAVQRAIHSVRIHPEYQAVQIDVSCEGSSDGWFDSKRLERVFLNLLLNACEAVPRETGHIWVKLRQTEAGIETRISDNGRGIAPAVRDTLFEPFVSCDKENGTGMGLTVVQKIIQDHGGEITVESSSAVGTVFRLFLPAKSSPEKAVLAEK